MRITYDPAKRTATLRDRQLDFEDAAALFAGPVFTFEDDRIDYGERRMSSFGRLSGRVVNVVWTGDDEERRVISMRKADEREQRRYQDRLG